MITFCGPALVVWIVLVSLGSACGCVVLGRLIMDWIRVRRPPQ